MEAPESALFMIVSNYFCFCDHCNFYIAESTLFVIVSNYFCYHRNLYYNLYIGFFSLHVVCFQEHLLSFK